MKISEMTNDQAAEALVKIAPAVSVLLADKNTSKLLTKLQGAEGMEPAQIISTVLPELVAFCMKDHKKEVYAIVAALSMKSAGEVGKMNFIETVKIVKDSFDEDLLNFFRSSGDQTMKPGN